MISLEYLIALLLKTGREKDERKMDPLLEQAEVDRDDPLLHLERADVYDSLRQAEDAIREYEAGGIGSRRWPLTAN